MKKKAIGILLMISLIFCTVSGCGAAPQASVPETEAPAAESGEATPAENNENDDGSAEILVTVVMPGDKSTRLDEYLTNEYIPMVKAATNVTLEFTYIPWGQYHDKIKLMLASNQKIDLFWDGIGNLAGHMSKKELLPLNDLIDQYGQNIKKMIPEKHFEATTISGNIYAIPSSYGPAAEKFNSILVRQDILEAVDMEKIASLAELESYAAMATEKFPEMKVATFFPYDLPAELMRELLDDSYTSLSDVFYVNESAAEAAVYDIDEIGLLKKVNEITSAWRERGWIPEEAFVKSADGIGRMDSGTYLMTEGAVSRPMENVLNLRKNVPEGKYAEYLLSPDKAKYIKIPGNEALMISSYSTAGEGVIKWLNWIYESQENYNATVLGTEGIDYQLVDGKYEALHNDAMLYEWIFRNINYMVYPTYADDTFINAFQNWDNDAQYSKAFGFAFNGEALKAELAKVDSVNQEILYPIILGYADYAENIQKLRDAWNAAGLDQIKAAYNEQLKAYSGN